MRRVFVHCICMLMCVCLSVCCALYVLVCVSTLWLLVCISALYVLVCGLRLCMVYVDPCIVHCIRWSLLVHCICLSVFELNSQDSSSVVWGVGVRGLTSINKILTPHLNAKKKTQRLSFPDYFLYIYFDMFIFRYVYILICVIF